MAIAGPFSAASSGSKRGAALDFSGSAIAAPNNTGGNEPPSDAELVAGVLSGNTYAFQHLYRRHEQSVRLSIGSIVRDRSTQEDLVQDAFTLAFRRLSTLRDHSLFRPWLARSARNLALDHVRSCARRPNQVAFDPELQSADASPDEVAELHDLAARLANGVVRLARRDAVAITLTVQFGMGPSELAEALGVTPNNAKVILHRARKHLREAAGITES